jgi:hypothetical protein
MAFLAVADISVFLDQIGDLAIQRINEQANGPFSENLVELRAASLGCGFFGVA